MTMGQVNSNLPTRAELLEADKLRQGVRDQFRRILSLPAASNQQAAALKLAMLDASVGDANRVLSMGLDHKPDNAGLAEQQMKQFVTEKRKESKHG